MVEEKLNWKTIILQYLDAYKAAPSIYRPVSRLGKSVLHR